MMRSRIATAAVAATLVAGLGACSSTSKGAPGGAPTAAGTSASATVPSATATTPASTASDASGASGASGTPAAFSADQLETMRAKVAAVYGEGVTAPAPQLFQMTPDPKELAADFDSATTMKALWGSGGTGADRLMDCGTAKYDGVAIGAVQSSGETTTVPVTLYQGAKAGGREITVTVDPGTGVIKGVSCGTPKAADFPGISPIAAYYGATANMDTAVLNDKSMPYFTPAFATWKPADTDYNRETCTQDVPDFWIVALTGATSAASAWDYSPAPVRTIADPAEPGLPVGFTGSMAVDLGSSKISRVSCAAKPSATDSAHPSQYADALMEYYRLAADQTSLGVDAKAAIQPYFVSDAALTAAWSATGPVPLLCANKVPGAVEVADGSTPTTSGSTTTLKMVTWPMWHPDQPGQELSKFTLTLDTSTMKIASITCTK
ncbi:hypothetical protein ABIA35_002807 [Catenulispora sp. MAP12-49]|uniref:hypothetical protein n=1 Tax=Catenulispora sp. MAP12-49 TaxID=3156302 RepID=UPI0035155965